MSDQGRDNRDLPRRPRDLDLQYSHHQSGEEDRDRPYDHHGPRQGNMGTSTITLPPIQDQYGAGPYGAPPPRGGGYPPDPRAGNAYGASPNSVNGYGPPSNQPPYLPPLQPHGDPRSPTYPSAPRDEYYRPPPPPQGGQYQEPYYAGYNRGPPPPPGYGPPGPYGPHHYDYNARGGGPPPMPQAAPRQRTSIACKYCRKRKVCVLCVAGGQILPSIPGSAPAPPTICLLTRDCPDSMQRLPERARRKVRQLQ